jgi:hypothetical protein
VNDQTFAFGLFMVAYAIGVLIGDTIKARRKK